MSPICVKIVQSVLSVDKCVGRKWARGENKYAYDRA